MRLKGKIAVVAGAGAGIGRATAMLFAEEGARVALISRKEKVAKETADIIAGRDAEAFPVAADLSKGSEAEEALKKIADHFGRIDVLHCNMGAYSTGPTQSMTETVWEDMFDANLKSTFLTVRAAIPHFLKNGSGSIILTAAVFGNFLTTTNMAHYNASKAGVVAFTKSMALELAPSGIRVNCVCPGQVSHQVRTRGAAAVQTEKALLRGGLPEDIAFSVLYLASDEASWVTGSTLVVDGGLSVGLSPGALKK